MTLGEKITLLRKQKGWSQEELADRLDISRQSVSKWESNASVPDLDKIIKLSVIFSVSTDYLLKDEEEQNAVSDESLDGQTAYREEMPARKVTVDEAVTYMNLTKSLSLNIAIAVSLCVLSPICMLIIGGLSEYGVIGMSEDMAGSIGLVILFLILIVAVPILIISGMKLGKYDYMEKERLSLEYGVKEQVAAEKEAYAPVFQKSIALGVAMIFFGVIILAIPAIIYEQERMIEIGEVYAIGVLLSLVAVGVFFFVKSGIVYGSFDKLLQEGDYTVEQKQISKKTEAFAGAYWCIVTAIYLGVSFTENHWDSTWVIWPVAGVLFAALMIIINAAFKRKRHK